ncbi:MULTISPECIES: hypothetical protein [Bradyrhizobium]|uniref:hypothetical protein n=1 Tax=Bradyrhizobium TaxID=374 RepID=UPI001FD9868F|nr:MULTISPECIES: hypothetical protein [Bradyrhizobium]MCP1744822.1 hypothetical protein [Bradyrhizobium japonicum]MCP1862452.1 hypothetical protein [Bradyrhizobium japonicum]MCP1893308.1 hypothetical protein [Bradyrhizobium japonicum]MCW2326419.1 hypothetical protein [Bradyrhizobium japonicum]WLC03310.1 hypothetical protein QIH92_09430 [Bradyrhizobium japonicum USDA 123]
MADLDGEEAVGNEVVEFEHVADGGCECCSFDVERRRLLNSQRHFDSLDSLVCRT